MRYDIWTTRVCQYTKGLLISSSSSGGVKTLITRHLPFFFFQFQLSFVFLAQVKIVKNIYTFSDSTQFCWKWDWYIIQKKIFFLLIFLLMKSKIFWPILFRLKNKIRNGFWFLFLWSRIPVQSQLHYNIQIRG